MHEPELEQLSALVGSQAEQAPPPAPQVPSAGASHAAPAQQPVAHVCEQPSHTLFTQFALLGQLLHADPPAPHAPLAVPGRQTLPEQHPVGHEVLLHTHDPPEQTCPVAQADAPPHVQTPALEQPSAFVPQATQAPPLVPQLEAFGCWHAPPPQQPVGQDCALHTHFPPWHSSPLPHAPPDPHEQAPSEQPSEVAGSHAVHEVPFVPQAPVPVAVTHFAPSQHPDGHDTPSQTQFPLTQCWFAAHAGPVPHEQVPVFEQLSVRIGSHIMQPDPPKPQALDERALHVGPEQQPAAHVIAQPLHVPFVHISPFGQLWHEEPPLPHASPLLPAWHLSLASQQPVGHEVPSQTHWPLRQRWPVWHASPEPHLHCPPTQASADPGRHAMHAAPTAPHPDSEGGVHVSCWSQHPAGHEAASQTHSPSVHRCPGPQGLPGPH